MRIIDQSVEYVGGNVPCMNRAKHVELCGRVCYKSEDKITDDSAEKFIAGIIKRGHEAVLEHARITLNLSKNQDTFRLIEVICKYMHKRGLDAYLAVTDAPFGDGPVVSGNIRAWRELCRYMFINGHFFPDVIKRMWYENAPFFPEYIHEDDEHIYDTLTDIDPNNPYFPGDPVTHRWHTLRFICDRGVSHEIVRHRPASYCQESTRYCNYSKADFGGEITVIQPFYLHPGTKSYDEWKSACIAAENAYFGILNDDRTAQEARCVLPTCLKTELIMTATDREWLHFLKLRTAEAAHPQMREIATRAKELLIEHDAEVFSDESIRDAR